MLTKREIAPLARAARRAWESLGPVGRGDTVLAERLGDDFASGTRRFDLWRRDQLERVCGARSFRDCGHDDYSLLMAHFHHLAGETDASARQFARATAEGRRRALFLLERECGRRGVDWPEYPGAICRRQYKCPLAEASERQLWRLLYTVRSRRDAKGAKHRPRPRGGKSGPAPAGPADPSAN